MPAVLDKAFMCNQKEGSVNNSQANEIYRREIQILQDWESKPLINHCIVSIVQIWLRLHYSNLLETPQIHHYRHHKINPFSDSARIYEPWISSDNPKYGKWGFQL